MAIYSGFTHEKWWIFPLFLVCLPGRVYYPNIPSTKEHHPRKAPQLPNCQLLSIRGDGPAEATPGFGWEAQLLWGLKADPVLALAMSGHPKQKIKDLETWRWWQYMTTYVTIYD